MGGAFYHIFTVYESVFHNSDCLYRQLYNLDIRISAYAGGYGTVAVIPVYIMYFSGNDIHNI